MFLFVSSACHSCERFANLALWFASPAMEVSTDKESLGFAPGLCTRIWSCDGCGVGRDEGRSEEEFELFFFGERASKFYCDLQGRKINFTNSKTLVGVATDRGAGVTLACVSFHFVLFFAGA